jgi:hypothetical protein
VCLFSDLLDGLETPVPVRRNAPHGSRRQVETGRPDRIADLAAAPVRLHQPDSVEHEEVLGHGLTRHRQTRRQASGGGLALGQQPIEQEAIGLQGDVDVLLSSLGPSLDALEERAAAALRTGMGAWTAVRESFVGHLAGSLRAAAGRRAAGAVHGPAVAVPGRLPVHQDHGLVPAEPGGAAGDHERAHAGGHGYPQVRQLLATSFGLGDQDYVVAYETDDPAAFSDLVRALRGTEGRRATASDTRSWRRCAARSTRSPRCRAVRDGVLNGLEQRNRTGQRGLDQAIRHDVSRMLGELPPEVGNCIPSATSVQEALGPIRRDGVDARPESHHRCPTLCASHRGRASSNMHARRASFATNSINIKIFPLVHHA